jgi:polysaccharide biosynthesis transport protein
MDSPMEPQHYWLIFKRHWIPATSVFSAVFALALLNLSLQKPIYEAQGKLRFKPNSTSSLTGLPGGEVGKLDSLVQTNSPLTTEIGVIRTVPIVQETISKLNLKDAEGQLLSYNDFLKRLTVGNEKGTDLLTVGYQDPDPSTAKFVVSTLMKTYLDHHLHENRAQAVAALEFIEQQLPDAESSVQTAESKLRQFKEDNQVAAIDRESEEAVTGLEDLRRQVVAAQSELANASAQSSAFQQELAMNPREATAIASLSQSEGVQDALKQLQTVEAQLAVEQARFQGRSPIIISLVDRKTNLEALLNTRIQQVLAGQSIQANQDLQIGELKTGLIGDFVRSEVKRTGLANQVAVLSSAEGGYKQRIRALPRLEQEQRELERKLDAAQSTYSLLLQKFHEIRVAERQNLGNAQTIQPAYVSDTPVAPRKSTSLAAGGLLGIMLAGAVVYILETKDKSLKTVKEVREIFGYTVLAVIPFHQLLGKRSFLPMSSEQPASAMIVRDLPNSHISETYRMLQANLRFLRPDQPLRTIVITSAVAHEGKSTVAANLAMAMAQSGHQVLVIDADMRSPGQHQFWNIFNDCGLSNVLGEQLYAMTAIQSVAEGLDVLTAGVIPPNPAILLDSQRMATLISQFARCYQFVILDTPPVTTAADATILGKLSDGVLLVARPNVVDVGSAGLAKERLEQSNQNILGQVINGVTPEHELASYYEKEFQPEGVSTPEHTKSDNLTSV